MHAELKCKTQQCNILEGKIKNIEVEFEEQSRLKRTVEKTCNNKIAQLKNQLIGAIRRINYLIEEKKNLLENDIKKSKYLAKLEVEYAKSKEGVKRLKKECNVWRKRTRSKTRKTVKSSLSQMIKLAIGLWTTNKVKILYQLIAGINTRRISPTKDLKSKKISNIESLKEVEKEIQRAQEEVTFPN